MYFEDIYSISFIAMTICVLSSRMKIHSLCLRLGDIQMKAA